MTVLNLDPHSLTLFAGRPALSLPSPFVVMSMEYCIAGPILPHVFHLPLLVNSLLTIISQ